MDAFVCVAKSLVRFEHIDRAAPIWNIKRLGLSAPLSVISISFPAPSSLKNYSMMFDRKSTMFQSCIFPGPRYHAQLDFLLGASKLY